MNERSRTARREGFSDENRIRLLETDMDDIATMVDRLEAALDGIRKVLVGLLISATTASMLLALNLVVGQ